MPARESKDEVAPGLLLKSFTTRSTTPPSKLFFVSSLPKSAAHPSDAIPAKPPAQFPEAFTVSALSDLTLQLTVDALANPPAKPPI